MYAIYADDVCIYNDIFALDYTKVVSPKLTLEDNSAGSLAMALPPTNVGYETISHMKTDISVRKDGEEIWAGRVLSESMDFWNNRVLYCEGELAFLNDSIQPPAEYSGLTIREYIEKMLDIHNSKVASNRQFAIGAVTVMDLDLPTYYTNYDKTMTALTSLVTQYGGHLRVRKVDGIRYLDYLEDYPDTCTQVIQFGSNLIDFTRNWDLTDLATVIIPLGNRLSKSEIESLDAYLTIESVNDGNIYIQSDEAVETYGWIEQTVSWDDVSDPDTLLEKAKEYLQDLQFDDMEIELSALDLHYLDVKYEAVKLLDEIRVISHPHGLDRLFPVTKLEIPLDSPEDTQFTLGDTVQSTITSSSNKANAEILQKIEDLPKAHTVLDEARENAASIMSMATTGFITITKDDYGSDTLYISNVRDYAKADKLWKWNMNGLGYSNDGGNTFGLAITMDGSIVADYITTGILNADIIRAGTIKDYGENVVWNLDDGSLTMKKGSIDLGDGNFKVETDGTIYARKGTFAGRLEAGSGLIGGFTIKSGWLSSGSGENYVALNGSTNDNIDDDGMTIYDKDYAMWAGAALPEAAPFYIKKNGELHALNGTFKGVIQGATVTGDIIGGTNSWLRGCGISIGGDNYKTGEGKFYVDRDGNVKISGNISWSAENSPCQVLYARTSLDSPTSKYSTYASSSSTEWHQTYDSSNDFYASYTYDGGQTWTKAVKISAKDGANGRNGSDANVPSYIKSSYIGSTKILSPDIYAGMFYATGRGFKNEAAYYIYDGCSVNQETGAVTLGNKIGYISYDENGNGNDAPTRVFFTTLNETAMKLQSAGNMSLEAKEVIYCHTRFQAAGGIRLNSISYGSKLPSSGEEGDLFFLIK